MVLIERGIIQKKILETIKTLPQTRGFESVSLYSDRINCENCQEVNFRAHRVTPYQMFSSSVYLLDAIAGGVSIPFLEKNLLASTHIKHVEMRSGPLQLGESITKNSVDLLVPFIDDLLGGQESLCSTYQ